MSTFIVFSLAVINNNDITVCSDLGCDAGGVTTGKWMTVKTGETCANGTTSFNINGTNYTIPCQVCPGTTTSVCALVTSKKYKNIKLQCANSTCPPGWDQIDSFTNSANNLSCQSTTQRTGAIFLSENSDGKLVSTSCDVNNCSGLTYICAQPSTPGPGPKPGPNPSPAPGPNPSNGINIWLIIGIILGIFLLLVILIITIILIRRKRSKSA